MRAAATAIAPARHIAVVTTDESALPDVEQFLAGAFNIWLMSVRTAYASMGRGPALRSQQDMKESTS